MLASIHPLGERARNRKWGVTVAAYVIGSVLGGVIIGALLGWTGSELRRWLQPPSAGIAIAIAAACAVGLALDLRVGGLRVPSIQRQVNKEWLDEYRGWVYGVGFGFQLGLAVVTVVNTAAVYVMLVLMLFSGSLVAATLIGVTFGLVRSSLIFKVAGVRRPDQLRHVLSRMQSWDPLAHRLGLAAQGAAMLAAATAAIH